jgi:hypothetical protein
VGASTLTCCLTLPLFTKKRELNKI